MNEFEKRLFSGEVPVSTNPDKKGEAPALSVDAIAEEAKRQADLAGKPEVSNN